MTPRQMRLTLELVALVASAAGDISPGPISANRRSATDADYDDVVRDILAGASHGEDVWVFAYGSLIWNPAFEYVEQRASLANGWHRSFCLGWDRRFRGSAQNPGLMLALDRGGRCKGVAYRLPGGAVKANLHTLVRREIHFIPHPFPARWISVVTNVGRIRAVTFAIDRGSGVYMEGLTQSEIADVLAVAVGQLGSMAEYLYSTVKHLEDLGIHDERLWQLQEMVAQRIEAASGVIPATLETT